MLVASNHHALIPFAIAVTTAAMLALSGCSSSSSDNSPSLRLMTVAVDADNDGTPNSIVNWFYDANGRATAEEFDAGADGSVESRYARVRDGNTLRIERDESVDGSIEGVTIWRADADGILASLNRAASEDGFAAESIQYISEDGLIVRADVDEGADGSIDSTSRFAFDASGLIASAGFDYDGDDIADDTLSVVREENGTVVRLEEDFGNDGGIDYVRILTYEQGPCDADDIANVAPPGIDICL